MIVGITISNSQVYFLGFFSEKHSLQFVDNKSIYIVRKDMVKQNITFCQTETFIGPSRVSLTHETLAKNSVWHNSSSSSHVLNTWLFSQVRFSRDSHEPVTKSTCSSFEAWIFTDLSHSFLTIEPTYIQGKWLKKLQ